MRRAAATLAILPFLTACAQHLEGIRADEPVAIVADLGRESASQIEIANRNIGRTAGKGWLGGSGVGAIAALACGPWWIICVTPGMVVFGSAGALAGAGVGAMLGLPAPTYESLLARAQSFQRERDARQRLVDAIAEITQRRWPAAGAGAATTVLVRIDRIWLNVVEDDRVGLAMRVTVTVVRPGAPADASRSRTFEYAGPPSEVVLWAGPDADFFAENFGQATRYIAYQVFAELAR